MWYTNQAKIANMPMTKMRAGRLSMWVLLLVARLGAGLLPGGIRSSTREVRGQVVSDALGL